MDMILSLLFVHVLIYTSYGTAIPRLEYEFDDLLEESGDSTYTLVTYSGATIDNGVLDCGVDLLNGESSDSNGYVQSASDLDFAINGSHSLEVIAKIEYLDNIGGGTIAIEKNSVEFDSIVYNELPADKDRIWFLGSENFDRTLRGNNAADTLNVEETLLDEWIHLIAVYDVENNRAKLYRNGDLIQDYTPSMSFFTIFVG